MTYTREQIMQMSPDELRVAVAKAKGWRVYIINADIAPLAISRAWLMWKQEAQG